MATCYVPGNVSTLTTIHSGNYTVGTTGGVLTAEMTPVTFGTGSHVTVGA